MTISVHLQTKIVAAALAAGVVAAAAPVVSSPPPAIPAIYSADIRPASVVSDALFKTAGVVDGVVGTAAELVDYIAELPEASLALLSAGLQHPAAVGSLVSFAVQAALNPDYGAPHYLFPGSTLRFLLSNFAQNLLPAPLNSQVNQSIQDASVAAANLFQSLPDPSQGDALVENAIYGTDLGRLLLGAAHAVTGPVHVVVGYVRALDFLPYQLEAAAENAFRDPAAIPGLVGYLARQVISGIVGPITDLADFAIDLPAPIGATTLTRYSLTTDGIAWNAEHGFFVGLGHLLDRILPAPVTPVPAAAARRAAKGIAPQHSVVHTHAHAAGVPTVHAAAKASTDHTSRHHKAA